jgi:DNA-binding PadR family transcriptional regulator
MPRPIDAGHLLPLSPQVLQVLLSLHQGPLHGYSIIQDVRERTRDEIRLTASTLYDALARLVEQGLIAEAAAPAEVRDARRRYYELTTLGRQATQLEVERLERLLRTARAMRAARRGSSR